MEAEKEAEYRKIGSQLKDYPEEDVKEARKLVVTLIKAGEDVEEVNFFWEIDFYSKILSLHFWPRFCYFRVQRICREDAPSAMLHERGKCGFVEGRF